MISIAGTISIRFQDLVSAIGHIYMVVIGRTIMAAATAITEIRIIIMIMLTTSRVLIRSSRM
jgi:hypothetical protein